MSFDSAQKKGIGYCHGSFGELLQGVLPGNDKFLVNLRIRHGSRVKVTLTSPRYAADKEIQIASSYQRYPKTHKMIRNVLSDLASHNDCLIEIDSEIPVGKGLSSSTADMVAAIRGLAQATSVVFRDEYISRVITEIEPNDGLHYQGTVAYHHATGQLIDRIDWVPQFRILGVDFGGVFDTVSFNHKELTFNKMQLTHYEKLLNSLIDALKAHDSNLVAEIASESTKLWQLIRPNPKLNRMLSLEASTDSLGLVNTHSGTYLGLLYDPHRTDWEEIEERVKKTLPNQELHWYETVKY